MPTESEYRSRSIGQWTQEVGDVDVKGVATAQSSCSWNCLQTNDTKELFLFDLF